VTAVSSSSDASTIKGSVSRERAEGISHSLLNPSTSASASFPPKTRNRKVATASHQQNALQELLQVWNSKSRQENHSPEDRFQLLELRDKILRLSEYAYIFLVVIQKEKLCKWGCSHLWSIYGTVIVVYTRCGRTD
jgi:hypothetical protein